MPQASSPSLDVTPEFTKGGLFTLRHRIQRGKVRTVGITIRATKVSLGVARPEAHHTLVAAEVGVIVVHVPSRIGAMRTARQLVGAVGVSRTADVIGYIFLVARTI